MKVIKRCEDNTAQALVECGICHTQTIADYYRHTKNPDMVCRNCKNINKIDALVNEKNSEDNGLYILNFTVGRSMCKVRCKHCNKEYESQYRKHIFSSYGCTNCVRKTSFGRTGQKHSTIGYKHPLYQTYHSIKQRCYNYKNTHYKYYGGKGVKICDEWLEDSHSFFDWSLANGWKKGLEIDKDFLSNKMNLDIAIYSPQTCLWVTHGENMSFVIR